MGSISIHLSFQKTTPYPIYHIIHAWTLTVLFGLLFNQNVKTGMITMMVFWSFADPSLRLAHPFSEVLIISW